VYIYQQVVGVGEDGGVGCSNWILLELIKVITKARPFFFLNFKGTPSQEKQKTVFSGLQICKMALSNQIDFPAIFSHRQMTYRNFINT
jgi:hypothetical protein